VAARDAKSGAIGNADLTEYTRLYHTGEFERLEQAFAMEAHFLA